MTDQPLTSERTGASAEDVAKGTDSEDRVRNVWCEWLTALATDDEAAIATAMAYRELDNADRDNWLAALEQDFARLTVPRFAVYAPLLAVESDSQRRERMARALGPTEQEASPRCRAYALSGVGAGGLRAAVLVTPLYLDFVQVFACGYKPDSHFEWVRHDPIVKAHRAPRAGDQVSGIPLEASSLCFVVDGLAHLVLSLCRRGLQPPDALRAFADFFDPVSVQNLSEPAV